MSDMEQKAISLAERSALVRRAIRDAIRAYNVLSNSPRELSPVEVYETYVIVEEGWGDGLYWRAEYTMDESGAVSVPPVTAWEKVEKDWIATKSLELADPLVNQGGAVKMAPTGAVEGYLILFGEENVDATGDYFTKATDFDFDGEMSMTIRYDHGLDPTLKSRKLGKATVGIDEAGVWFKGQLDLRDQYEKYIQALGMADKLGTSSASHGGLVRRAKQPNGKSLITEWPLNPSDLTLTVRPAQPRQIMSIKSFPVTPLELPQEADTEDGPPSVPAADASPEPHTNLSTRDKETKVNPEITLAPEVVATLQAEVKNLTDKTIALEERMKATPVKAAGAFGGDVEKQKLAAQHKALSLYIKTGQVTPNLLIRESTDAQKSMTDLGGYEQFGEYAEQFKAALNEGTTTQGGFLVAPTYLTEMVRPQVYMSILRRAGANIISVNGGGAVKMPSVTYGAEAVLTAEAAAFDQQEPTFAELTFNPYKYTRLAKASDEVLRDSRFSVEGVVLEDFDQAFYGAENTAFTNGTGTGQPQGVVTGSTLGATAASATAISYDDLVNLQESLNELYHDNAVWMMNRAIVGAIRKLKDSQGRPLWEPAVQRGTPPTLLGYPVYTNPKMAAAPVATAKTILFGDMRYFRIVDWEGMSVLRLNELYAGNGQIGIRAFKRFDSRVVLPAAIKHLVH